VTARPPLIELAVLFTSVCIHKARKGDFIKWTQSLNNKPGQNNYFHGRQGQIRSFKAKIHPCDTSISLGVKGEGSNTPSRHIPCPPSFLRESVG